MYGQHIPGWERRVRESDLRKEHLQNCREMFCGGFGFAIGLFAVWLFFAMIGMAQ